MRFINRQVLFIVFVLIVSLLSCDFNHKKTNEIDDETPSTMEGEYSSGNILRTKSKYHTNILERLYEEAISKNKKIRKVDDAIELAYRLYSDSLSDYNRYIRLNKDYWNVANSYINDMSDSTLRNEVRSIFNKAEIEYCASKEELLHIDDKIDVEKKYFDNQVQLFKLIVTLQMVQRYQVNEFPDSSTMNSILTKFDHVNQVIETIVK